MSNCTCNWCESFGKKIKACDVKVIIERNIQLEAAMKDMLGAESVTDCLKCLHVFRILLEHG